MRTLIGALVVALLWSSAVAVEPDYNYKVEVMLKPPKTKAKDLTKEQFDAAVEGTIKNAESWMGGRIADFETVKLLNSVVYNKENVVWLKEAIDNLKIKAPKNIPGGPIYDAELLKFYVITKLIEPLQYSPPEAIREGLPLIKEMEKKYHNAYKPYPKYPPAVLKNFQIPDCKGMGVDARLKLLEQLDKHRQEKMFRERVITVNNELVGIIETVYINAMLNAQDPKEDAALVDWIADAEKKGNNIWFVGANTIISFAAEKAISPERAEPLYTALLALGEQLKWKEAKYIAAYLPKQLAADNSTLPVTIAAPGYVILTAAKYVGQVAKKPPLVVPHPQKKPKDKFPNDPEVWDPPKK